MSVPNPTAITKFNVGTAGGGVPNDRRAHLLRIEIDRSINSVGTWAAFLRNPGGIYNGVFDVQDRVEIGANTHDLLYGYVDGPAVELMGRDLESDWDEYVTLRGVDDAQDLLLHNDLAFNYPNIAQDLDDVLDNVINTQLDAISASPIWYTPRAGTPVVGACEFKAGTSFLTQLQELIRGAGYLFYVNDDTFELKIGSALAGVSSTAVVARSRLNDTTNTIIDRVIYQERDGDKLYNYVKLYGKAPMDDGYTEYNAAAWAVSVIGSSVAVLDNTTITAGGKSDYSLVTYNANPVPATGWLGMKLTNPVFNYNYWDLTKGSIGVWARYDNTAGAPGTPGAGNLLTEGWLHCYLTDTAGNVVIYVGSDSSHLYENHWGYCTFPLGESSFTAAISNNNWHLHVGVTFLWDSVRTIEFILYNGAFPLLGASHLYIDGLSLPFPILGFARDGPGAGTSEAKYRRRPYDDTWAHITTQNTIQNAADNFLLQSKLSSINKVKFVIPGDYRIRYAGQTFTLDIPSLGVNNSIYYATNLKHIIEPYVDVSGGFSFDWITEVEGVPTTVTGYDTMRLRSGPSYSAIHVSQRDGAGIRSR